MTIKLTLSASLIFVSFWSQAQNGWSLCNSPFFTMRVDDVYMVDTQTGYAVCGDGQIVKTTDGGSNWFMLVDDTSNYLRSVEFINAQKGFVGGFPSSYVPDKNILRKTLDGGTTWTDLTPLLNPIAQQGICGLCAADSITIYGCGNWYRDSAYIVKSADGGNTWSFIDMHTYAASLIDMYFLSKDTGFATGRGPMPFQTAVILYTTDGGQTWTYKFQNTITYEYCWKIQHLTNKIYFASIEDMTTNTPAKILKSIDGGMTWAVLNVLSAPGPYDIEGVGFIDSLKGWVGDSFGSVHESNDGGITWNPVSICPDMNRVFKVNDSLLFACGLQIWKYSSASTGVLSPGENPVPNASLTCYPTPANDMVSVDISLSRSTRALIVLLDEKGSLIQVIDNAEKAKGVFHYSLNTRHLPPGIYNAVLKTHEDQRAARIVIGH